MKNRLFVLILSYFLFPISHKIYSQNTINKKFSDASVNFPQNLTATSTMDVVSIDIDNDGDKDLILACEFCPNKIFFNKDGKFEQKLILPSLMEYKLPLKGEDSEDIAYADFDLDGDIDLFFVSEDTKNHELLMNNGNGTFVFHPNQISKIGKANAVLIYDFNQDNYPDILIGIKGRNELFINNKGKEFINETNKYWVENNDDTQDLILVDIDNDGDKDIVEGIEKGGNNIYVNANGKFIEETSKRLPDMSQIETRKVIASDIDNDGDQDLYYCNVGWSGKNAQNILLINNGNGYFTNNTENVFPIDQYTTLDAVFTDINNDGKLDLITTNGFNKDGTNFLTFMNTSKNGILQFKTNHKIFPKLSYSTGITIVVDTFNNNGKKGIYLGNFRGEDLLIYEK